jgi:hypothetical protein
MLRGLYMPTMLDKLATGPCLQTAYATPGENHVECDDSGGGIGRIFTSPAEIFPSRQLRNASPSRSRVACQSSGHLLTDRDPQLDKGPVSSEPGPRCASEKAKAYWQKSTIPMDSPKRSLCGRIVSCPVSRRNACLHLFACFVKSLWINRDAAVAVDHLVSSDSELQQIGPCISAR